jgi:hypothetical protein
LRDDRGFIGKRILVPSNWFQGDAEADWRQAHDRERWTCRVIRYEHAVNAKNQRWVFVCDADCEILQLSQEDELPEYKIKLESMVEYLPETDKPGVILRGASRPSASSSSAACRKRSRLPDLDGGVQRLMVRIARVSVSSEHVLTLGYARSQGSGGSRVL